MQFDHRRFQRTPMDFHPPPPRVLNPRVSELQRKSSSEAVALQLRILHDLATATFSQTSLAKDISRSQPCNTGKKQNAAVIIQKLMRGWWQRLQFRILFLQHQLNTQKERTEESISRIQERLQKRKEAFRKKMQKQAKKKAQALEELTKQTYDTVFELRKMNEKLKEENVKLAKAIQILQTHNEKLVAATVRADAYTAELGSHVVQIQKSNEMLRTVIPKFQSTIAVLEESLKIGQQYRRSEQSIKVMYLRTIGKIVEDMEDSCSQDELVYEVVEECLVSEEMDLSMRPVEESQ